MAPKKDLDVRSRHIGMPEAQLSLSKDFGFTPPLYLCVLVASDALVQCGFRHTVLNGLVSVGELFPSMYLLKPLIHCEFDVLFNSSTGSWC